MDDGRWYPTVTTAADGKVYFFSGNGHPDNNCARNKSIERFDPSGTGDPEVVVEDVEYSPHFYPRSHLVSRDNGVIAAVGPEPVTRYFNTLNPAVPEIGDTTNVGATRAECTSVLLPIDMWEETPIERILLIGGYVGGNAEDSCEILDATAAVPAWANTDDLNFARAHANVVLLADGNVFLVGGGTDGAQGCPIFVPELYDVGTDTWTALTNAQHTLPRMYHSVALLLLDGSVWTSGQNQDSDCGTAHWDHGGDKAEIYYPAYYDEPRPVITDFPASVEREDIFDVEFTVDEGRSLDSVALISLSAVTHSVNMTQRYLVLQYQPSISLPQTLVHVEAPPVAYAPPGPYMLVVIDDEGIPSVAKVIYLE